MDSQTPHMFIYDNCFDMALYRNTRDQYFDDPNAKYIKTIFVSFA